MRSELNPRRCASIGYHTKTHASDMTDRDECASKMFNIYSKMSSDDEYYTPPEHWIAVREFLPPSQKVVWEAFCGDGRSGQTLTELGCTVIQGRDVDFFDDNNGVIDKYDVIVSNIPFSHKKEILERLKKLDKPFLIIMPGSTMFTKYLRELFGNEMQIIIPRSRMHFVKNEVLMTRTSFDCCYFAYKMNYPRDVTWL